MLHRLAPAFCGSFLLAASAFGQNPEPTPPQLPLDPLIQQQIQQLQQQVQQAQPAQPAQPQEQPALPTQPVQAAQPAQEGQRTGSPAPIPGLPGPTPAPANPVTVPVPASAPAAAATPIPQVRLDFPNSDVRDVINFYGGITNKRPLYDNTVQGPINLTLPGMFPADEAARIIETALLLNNFSIVPGEDNVIKVVGVSKNPRSVGVPLISSEAEIPANDQVVSFLFKPQFADPTELTQVLQLYVPPSPYTATLALPKAGAILITESSPVLRSLMRLLREIDVAPAEVRSEFIRLERADAKDVIEKLEKIFEKQPTQGGAPSVAPPRVPQMPGEVPQPLQQQAPTLTISSDGGNRLSEDSIIIGKIRLTADIRTNRIHVVTRPVNLPFIRKLIQEFDSNIKFGEPTVRVLKYVSAGDVLDVVVKTIAEKGEKTEDVAGGQAGNNRPAQASTAGNSSFGSNSGFGSSGSGGMNVSEGLETEARDTVPKAITVGNTKIIADLRNNSIIVLGNDEVKQKIFQVLDELDNRAPQVMLRTVIGELGMNDQFELGFNYFLGNNDVNGRIVVNRNNNNNNNGNGTTTDPGTTITTPGATTNSSVGASRSGIVFNNTGAPGLDFPAIVNARNLSNITPFLIGGATGINAFLAAGDSLGATVKALESTGRFRVVQSPVVFASNNKKAIIASGEEIAVPTQTLTSLTNGNVVNDNSAVSSNVQYKQVALQLEVVPLINKEREVALDILQKLDSKTDSYTQVGGNQIPTIATRYIKTNVTVPNGATIALGGLVKNERSSGNSGVPYLQNIPVVGYLFKSRTRTDRRSELIILMKPEVVNDPAEIKDSTVRTQEKLDLEQDLEATLDASSASRAKRVRPESVKTETTTRIQSERSPKRSSKSWK